MWEESARARERERESQSHACHDSCREYKLTIARWGGGKARGQWVCVSDCECVCVMIITIIINNKQPYSG